MKSKQVALSLAILLALGTGTVLHVEDKEIRQSIHVTLVMKTRLPGTIV